jgi:hypothetical protein
MNRIVVIGNGFDIAHGLPTKYEDFINHLKNSYVEFIKDEVNANKITEHKYFSLSPKAGASKRESEKRIICTRINELKNWDDIPNLVNVEYRSVDGNGHGSDKYYQLRITFKNRLINLSFENYQQTSWGGIENDYKNALVKILTSQLKLEANIHAETLNKELAEIIGDLVNYLKNISIPGEISKDIISKLYTKPLLEWRGNQKEVEKLGSP